MNVALMGKMMQKESDVEILLKLQTTVFVAFLSGAYFGYTTTHYGTAFISLTTILKGLLL